MNWTDDDDDGPPYFCTECGADTKSTDWEVMLCANCEYEQGARGGLLRRLLHR